MANEQTATMWWYVIVPAAVAGVGLCVCLAVLLCRCLRRSHGRYHGPGGGGGGHHPKKKHGPRPFFVGRVGGGAKGSPCSARSTASLLSTSSSPGAGGGAGGGGGLGGRGVAPLIPRNQSTEIQIPERRPSFRSPTIPELDPGQFRTECYKTADGNASDRSSSSPPPPSEREKRSDFKSDPEQEEEEEEENNSGGGGGADSLGTLSFTVDYDPRRESLTVGVVRASDLPAKDASTGSSDPYVKLHLLPEKRQKAKTRVVRRSLDPVFDEAFTFFGVARDQLPSITLQFVVLSFDRFSRDDLIGEVLYALPGAAAAAAEEGLGGEGVTGMAVVVCREILPRHVKIHSQGRGELLISICYQPSADRMTVVVLKAKNLPKMDITGLSDPYVKVYLMLNGQRIAKKKTHVKKRTLNPVFNESFQFDLPANEDLQNLSLEFLVFDWDRVTKNEVIGRLEIGTAVPGSPEASHWKEVVNCPRKQIAEWHRLKDL